MTYTKEELKEELKERIDHLNIEHLSKFIEVLDINKTNEEINDTIDKLDSENFTIDFSIGSRFIRLESNLDNLDTQTVELSISNILNEIVIANIAKRSELLSEIAILANK